MNETLNSLEDGVGGNVGVVAHELVHNKVDDFLGFLGGEESLAELTTLVVLAEDSGDEAILLSGQQDVRNQFTIVVVAILTGVHVLHHGHHGRGHVDHVVEVLSDHGSGALELVESGLILEEESLHDARVEVGGESVGGGNGDGGESGGFHVRYCFQ